MFFFARHSVFIVLAAWNTGADGAAAASSAAVAHASTSVSNVKQQTTITASELGSGNCTLDLFMFSLLVHG